MTARPRGRRVVARASSCDSTSSLYSYPLATDTLPVYEPVTIEWNPDCVTIASSQTVDLYLNVQQTDGLVAVHEWTGVNYAAGKLETVLKPNWWNASTGAGSVQAQLGIVPAGQPIWNTPAPSGPLFTVAYNGSYPSVTDTAPVAVYTGPSVESVADKNSTSSTPTGGKLGAAIVVPLVVVALAIAGYVTWNRYKKRPQKKRFSAVVDQRMSMISQGTWQPRPSMAQSVRPGSHRPSGSMYSTGNRHSYFADPNQRNSTYSALNGGVPSPLRPPQPAEMRQRQVGEGDRVSRVSFAGGAEGRPSFSSSRAGGHAKSSSIYNRTPQSPQLSRSQGSHSSSASHGGGGIPLSKSSSSLGSTTSSRFEDPMSRSGTREELRDSPSVNQLSTAPLGGFGRTPYSHHKTASSLRNELASSQDPFETPAVAARPKLSPLATNSSFMMPQLNSDVLSPDQALASYSFARALSPSTGPDEDPASSSAKTLEKSKSSTSLKGGFGKMLKKFKSQNSLKQGGDEQDERGRSTSPFEDPVMVLPPISLDQTTGDEWYGDEAREDDEKREGDGLNSWKGGKAL
ncbi:hypothetical protein JCM3766R1_004510 [Sporobolomyces carnicolor]